MPQRVAVVGAGIVGISTALFLQRDGHAVTVLDPRPPGHGASAGCAGIISVSCTPEATPGVLRRVPRMLLDPTGPLVVRWSYLPRIAPWLWRFVRATRPRRIERAAAALAALSARALEAYRLLLDQAGATTHMRSEGWLKVYRTEAAFDASQTERDLMARHDFAIDVLDADEVRQLEPALAPIFRRGLLLRDSGGLVDALAADLVRRGGRLRRETVRHIEVGDRGPRVVTDLGSHTVDATVLCAGAWSRRLAAQLGVRVPLDTERGYHLMLPQPEPTLRRPVLIADHYFVLAPMTEGLRLTSAAELGGLEAPPDLTRPYRLLPLAQQAIPGLVPQVRSTWLGFRPSLPDSIPVIGAVPGVPGAYLAFGHGHLGLTHGPITGRVVADLIGGRDPGFDLSPFDPRR